MQLVQILRFGVLVAACVAAPAGAGSTIQIDRRRYMPLDEIRPGMTGFGKTVLRGTKIETFKVEVISVLRNIEPKMDMIFARCAEANLEHTGIIAGMSGSPVYLYDPQTRRPRLIGAVAFGDVFNKDPICGLQPIEQMLQVTRASTQPALRARRVGRAARAVSRLCPIDPDDRFVLAGLGRPMSASAADPPASLPFGLQPLATPLAVAGASPGAMDFLRKALQGTNFVPVVAGGASAPASGPSLGRLEPGAVLSIPFMTGDLEAAAIGTVTDVIGNRVLGFGHPMLGEGRVELPFATGMIHTVIPSLFRSVKVGSAVRICGALVVDESTGVLGYVGRSARMVPVRIRIREAGRERNYSLRCLHHEQITPSLIGAAVISCALAHADLPREHTLRYTIRADFERLGTYRVQDMASQSGVGPVRSDITTPLLLLMDSEFGRARLRSVQMDLTIEPVARAAVMEQVELARDVIRPGQDLSITVTWRRYRGERTVGHYTMKVPADLPEGTYELSVCSWQAHLNRWRAEKPHLFKYRSLPQMFEAITRVASVRKDRLFLRLKLPTGGVALEGEELPELPSFRRQILASSKRTDVTSYTESIVAEVPLPFEAEGMRSLKIRIDKRADQ